MHKPGMLTNMQALNQPHIETRAQWTAWDEGLLMLAAIIR